MRSRVFSCSESDGPGTVKSYKVEAHAAFARKPMGFTALQPQRCPCEQHKLRDIRYIVDMRDLRDKVEAHGAFARVFVLGKRWAWDSQVLQS